MLWLIMHRNVKFHWKKVIKVISLADLRIRILMFCGLILRLFWGKVKIVSFKMHWETLRS